MSRISSLDGLRGVAAMIVVVHHLALTSPAFAQASMRGGETTADWWVWWLTYTPLHLVWAGTEAVYIFFVLSGFVLTLPWFTGRARGWAPYYAARLLRLYLPVLGSLVLATALVVVVYPRTGSTGSSWLDVHVGLDPLRALSDALLVTGPSAINSPLWSLQYEVLFSLLLPLYVFAMRITTRPRARAGISTAMLLALLALAWAAGVATRVTALEMLPVFGVGAVIAAHHEDVARIAARISAHRGAWVALGVACVLLLTLTWMLRGIPDRPAGLHLAGRGSMLVGAALAVVLAMYWPRLRSALDHRAVRWLGAISFSLYLVHEPIVVATAFVVGSTQLWLTALIAVPLSLGVAWLFFALVEKPSHRLSQAVGRRLVARGETGAEAVAEPTDRLEPAGTSGTSTAPDAGRLARGSPRGAIQANSPRAETQQG